jgi:dynein intermediate chain
VCVCVCVWCSKAGLNEAFEGHQGPVTGIDCNAVPGPIDFSPFFLTSSIDWTVKMWNIKVCYAALLFSLLGDYVVFL